MDQSEDITALAGALAKAQARLKGAEKDATNPHLKSGYASLASVWEACRGPLTENGLAVVQGPTPAADGCLGLATMLVHESGQWIKSTCFIPLSKPDPQTYGSCLTYLRRYSLSAMVGVYPDDDDDGHAATAHQRSKAAAPPQQRQEAAPTPESRGDAAANGAADPEKARKAFFAAFNERWPKSSDPLRYAILSELIGKPIGGTGDWTPRHYNAAAGKIRDLDADTVRELLGRAQDRLQEPPPAADGTLGLDADPFGPSTDATPRFAQASGH